MNRHDHSHGGLEAVVHYENFEFRVVRHGSFVRCAITGRQIALRDLLYWNVDRQEAYADAAVAGAAYTRYIRPPS